MKVARHDVNDGVVRLAVSGEIDLATADSLLEAIMQALSTNPAEVVLDLADVTFCDSTGIGMIIRARKIAAEQGITVQVINPRGMVYRALDVTGVLGVLTGES